MSAEMIVLDNPHMEAVSNEVDDRISQLPAGEQVDAMSDLRTALTDLTTMDQLVYLESWLQGFDYVVAPCAK